MLRSLFAALAGAALVCALFSGEDARTARAARRPPVEFGLERAPSDATTAEAPPVADLLGLLDAEVPRKWRIVRGIAEARGPEAWAGLVARLGDPSLRTAIEAALGRSAPKGVIEELKLDLLRSPDGSLRASLVRILAETADPRHGAEVRALLDREADDHVRRAAICALGRFGDGPSVDALLDLTRRGGGEARLARLALDDAHDGATLLRAAGRWPELDHDTRAALLHAARYADAGPFLAVAADALLDPDERVRLVAVDLLARAGDDAVEPLLDHALRGAETELAIRALAGLGTRRAAEAGLRALAGLPSRRLEPYRAAFLATLAR